jgi:hypothetical protein
MNTGEVREVKWKDPAMLANTNPLLMNWYVSIPQKSCTDDHPYSSFLTF